MIELKVIFFIVGAVVAAVVGLRLLSRKIGLGGAITSAFAYLVCELLSNFASGFLAELVLLFVGTAALGCCLGFVVSFVARRIRKRE